MSPRTFVPRSLSIGALIVALAAVGRPAHRAQRAGSGRWRSHAATRRDSVATPAGSGAGPVTGHLGDKLTFPFLDSTVDATLVKVFDPATPNDASEAPLATGFHWVGVEVILDNHSSDFGSEASDIDGLASDGSTVTTTDSYQGGSYSLGDGFQGCTQTDGEEQEVEPYTHCEAFAVPDGKTLTQVGAKVGGASLDVPGAPDQVIWTIP